MAESQQFGGYGYALSDEAGRPDHELAPPHIMPTTSDQDSSSSDDKHEKPVDESHAQHVTLRQSEEDGFDYNVSDEDRATLRRVPAAIPVTAFLIAICELAERFSYYGTTTVFQNMIQQGLPPGSTTGAPLDPDGSVVPGIYGRGQQTATGITTFNTFWVYCMPLLGGWLADTHLGRFNVICLGVLIALIGHFLFIIATIPPVITSDLDGSLACFVLGVIINGVGTGFFKSTVSVLIAEQIKAKRQYVKVTSKGERVLVDPVVTAASLYMWFYLAINVGAIAGQVAMPFAERYVGFWLSMLLPTIVFMICIPVLFFARGRYVKYPPAGSVLSNALRLAGLALRKAWSLNPVVFWRNIRAPTFWNAAMPSQLGANQPKWMAGISDEWVMEVRRGYKACYVFLLFPWYWLCYNQISGNLISQGASMTLNGVPNEIPQNFDPLSIIIFVPLFEFAIYPGLRRLGIKFTALKKIFTGFMCASAAMIAAAVIQHYIYQTSPCGDQASECDEPSPLPVWIQVVPYAMVGLSEIFASVTSLEYAYTKAPKNMRSLVMAVGLFTNAIAAAIQQAFLPLVNDPLLTWMYTAFACIAFVAGCLFAVLYRHIDREEDELNNLPSAEYQDARKVHNHATEEWDMHNADHHREKAEAA